MQASERSESATKNEEIVNITNYLFSPPNLCMGVSKSINNSGVLSLESFKHRAIVTQHK